MSGAEPFEIGYREDGVFWLTASASTPDAAAAERYLGRGWRAVDDVFVGPTGRMVNNKDEEWAECEAGDAGAHAGWRLVNTSMPEILDEGEWIANPHFDPRLRSTGS